MVTAQIEILETVHLVFGILASYLAENQTVDSRTVDDGGTLKREMSN